MRTSTAGNWNNPCPKRRGRTGGFTLLELLLVMVIMAVMAALALPSLDLEEGPTDLARAAVRIKGAIEDARARTILTRQPHQLVFSENSVTLMPDGNTSTLPGSVVCKAVDMDDDTDAGGFPRVLPFHPRGACAPAAVVISDDTTMTLLVRPFLLETQERHGFYSLSQLTGATSP